MLHHICKNEDEHLLDWDNLFAYIHRGKKHQFEWGDSANEQ